MKIDLAVSEFLRGDLSGKLVAEDRLNVLQPFKQLGGFFFESKGVSDADGFMHAFLAIAVSGGGCGTRMRFIKIVIGLFRLAFEVFHPGAIIDEDEFHRTVT
jgi:hypothetical protein